MEDVTAAPLEVEPGSTLEPARREPQIVSTHVLVPEEQSKQLRDLSRRTRVPQSEYLREAVDDLLIKYGKLEDPKR
jgi:hypothetical protein